jgi:ElaB/YqjD/DUF883 family membrane-anchored ribosome-binding protein
LNEEKYGAEDELHHIKRMLSNFKQDIAYMGEDTEAALAHYGKVTREKATVLVHELDERLERAHHRTRAKAESAPVEKAGDYHKMADGLHTLRQDLERHFHKIGDDTHPEHTAGIIDEFHSKVDDHLEWMRRTGREW